MKNVMFARVLFIVWLVLALAVSAQAQHRYLGEGGARVLQCARFYSSLEAQLLCARGDELRAGQLERLGMLDNLSSDLLVRQTETGTTVFGYNGGDGYLYHTDSVGRRTGTREKIVTGGAIGATLGAGIGAIFGRGSTGALLGAGTGAIVGAVSGSKANKKAKAEAVSRQQEEVSRQAELRTEAQARTERAEAASKEQKLLRNRFDATVRVIFRTPDGQISELTLDPGQALKINLLRGAQLILAEVECLNGEFDQLEYGSGKINLRYNSGWEFDPRSAPSICS